MRMRMRMSRESDSFINNESLSDGGGRENVSTKKVCPSSKNGNRKDVRLLVEQRIENIHDYKKSTCAAKLMQAWQCNSFK